MFYYACRSFGEDIILNILKITSNDLVILQLPFKAITKKCLFKIISENKSAQELSTYGEIQSEWHEGAPDWAFAPPN